MDAEVHATAVTASQSMPAGQLSVHTMVSCYNCCVHSLPHRRQELVTLPSVGANP